MQVSVRNAILGAIQILPCGSNDIRNQNTTGAEKKWKETYLERHFRNVPVFTVDNYVSNLANKPSTLDYEYNSDSYYIGVLDNIVTSLARSIEK